MAETLEKRALITGGGGFAGSRLLDYLSAKGWQATAFDLNLPSKEPPARVRYVKGDIRSEQDIKRALQESRPSVVFHLAGITFVPAADEDKKTAFDVNLVGGIHLIEGVKKTVPEARVVMISSSEVYGKVRPDEVPLKEDSPVRPANFYAFTKAALEDAAFYGASLGLPMIVLRPFNHIGPGQSALFVTSGFARQVAEAELGKVPPVIKVGNLDAVRDFTDVEDMIRAYKLAGEMELKGNLYNLSSGHGVKIKEILNHLLAMARVDIRVEKDPKRLRPCDIPVLIGDSTLFSQETGWSPQVSLFDSLSRILDYWRDQVSKGRGA